VSFWTDSDERLFDLQVVGTGAIPLLLVCAQEPETALKRAAASALSDLVKHSPEQAQAVVDAGAIACLTPLALNQDCKLKRQVKEPFCCAACSAVLVFFFHSSLSKARPGLQRRPCYICNFVQVRQVTLFRL
jgi:hypothetical protein